jgi:hypothetical protein
MEPVVRRLGKQVCFTELGYTASATAAEKPWAYEVTDPDPAYQARLYKVALEEARKRDYVVGAFVWKWFTSRPRGGGGGGGGGAGGGGTRRGDPFTMQDNPALLDVLRQAWKP